MLGMSEIACVSWQPLPALQAAGRACPLRNSPAQQLCTLGMAEAEAQKA